MLKRLPLVLLFSTLVFAQALKKPSSAGAPAEQRATKYFESVKHDPGKLRAFLYAMPKGGDLHNHLSGAVYAENYIQWAAEMQFCVETKTFTILRPKQPGQCDDPLSQRLAADAFKDFVFYRDLVDALSMRNWHPARKPGEYQFFDTFPKFNAVVRERRGDMVAELMHRAAAENVQYLELILMPELAPALAAAKQIEWSEDLSVSYQRLRGAGLKDFGRSQPLDRIDTRARQVLRCGGKDEDPGCRVTVRYICEIYRLFPKDQVFAQMVYAMEQVTADPRLVAVNPVQPEDGSVALLDYDLHMRMFDFLHAKYPKVHLTLHAGELTLGQVAPEHLGTHVAKAIDQGHAERIGHGTDILYYSEPTRLMAEMKEKRVAVEISLSSSDYILGVRGDSHPLRAYLDAGVPVVLATDDAGVARSDLTNEYLRAVLEHGLSYAELKRVARNAIEYGFLESAERARLRARFDSALARFEAAQP